MNITLNLNEEQAAVLADRVTAYNNGSGQAPLTAEEFITQVIIGDELNRLVAVAYNNSLATLGELYRDRPYAERIALIEQLRNSL